MNKEYRVRWDVDLTADTPHEAATMARWIQLNPHNLATVFQVTPWNADAQIDSELETVTIDLSEPREEPPSC